MYGNQLTEGNISSIDRNSVRSEQFKKNKFLENIKQQDDMINDSQFFNNQDTAYIKKQQMMQKISKLNLEKSVLEDISENNLKTPQQINLGLSQKELFSFAKRSKQNSIINSTSSQQQINQNSPTQENTEDSEQSSQLKQNTEQSFKRNLSQINLQDHLKQIDKTKSIIQKLNRVNSRVPSVSSQSSKQQQEGFKTAREIENADQFTYRSQANTQRTQVNTEKSKSKKQESLSIQQKDYAEIFFQLNQRTEKQIKQQIEFFKEQQIDPDVIQIFEKIGVSTSFRELSEKLLKTNYILFDQLLIFNEEKDQKFRKIIEQNRQLQIKLKTQEKENQLIQNKLELAQKDRQALQIYIENNIQSFEEDQLSSQFKKLNKSLKQKILELENDLQIAAEINQEKDQEIELIQEQMNNQLKKQKEEFTRKLEENQQKLNEIRHLSEQSSEDLKLKSLALTACEARCKDLETNKIQSILKETQSQKQNFEDRLAQEKRQVVGLRAELRETKVELEERSIQNQLFRDKIAKFQEGGFIIQDAGGVDVHLTVFRDKKMGGPVYQSIESMYKDFQGVGCFSQAQGQAKIIEKFIFKDQKNQKVVLNFQNKIANLEANYELISKKFKVLSEEKEQIERLLLEVIGYADDVEARQKQIDSQIEKVRSIGENEKEMADDLVSAIEISLVQVVKNAVIDIQDDDIKHNLLDLLTKIKREDNLPITLYLGAKSNQEAKKDIVEVMVQSFIILSKCLREQNLKTRKFEKQFHDESKEKRELIQQIESLKGTHQSLKSQSQSQMQQIDLLCQKIVDKINQSKVSLGISPLNIHNKNSVFTLRTQMNLEQAFCECNSALVQIQQWITEEVHKFIEAELKLRQVSLQLQLIKRGGSNEYDRSVQDQISLNKSRSSEGGYSKPVTIRTSQRPSQIVTRHNSQFQTRRQSEQQFQSLRQRSNSRKIRSQNQISPVMTSHSGRSRRIGSSPSLILRNSLPDNNRPSPLRLKQQPNSLADTVKPIENTNQAFGQETSVLQNILQKLSKLKKEEEILETNYKTEPTFIAQTDYPPQEQLIDQAQRSFSLERDINFLRKQSMSSHKAEKQQVKFYTSLFEDRHNQQQHAPKSTRRESESSSLGRQNQSLLIPMNSRHQKQQINFKTLEVQNMRRLPNKSNFIKQQHTYRQSDSLESDPKPMSTILNTEEDYPKIKNCYNSSLNDSEIVITNIRQPKTHQRPDPLVNEIKLTAIQQNLQKSHKISPQLIQDQIPDNIGYFEEEPQVGRSSQKSLQVQSSLDYREGQFNGVNFQTRRDERINKRLMFEEQDQVQDFQFKSAEEINQKWQKKMQDDYQIQKLQKMQLEYKQKQEGYQQAQNYENDVNEGYRQEAALVSAPTSSLMLSFGEQDDEMCSGKEYEKKSPIQKSAPMHAQNKSNLNSSLIASSQKSGGSTSRVIVPFKDRQVQNENPFHLKVFPSGEQKQLLPPLPPLNSIANSQQQSRPSTHRVSRSQGSLAQINNYESKEAKLLKIGQLLSSQLDLIKMAKDYKKM